ncbi:MAG: LCP family protein [Chloroflexi bacterium]|nr:LCP family protein [Chloroflexota bacterium]
MLRRTPLIIIVLALLISSCTVPGLNTSLSPISPGSKDNSLATIDPNGTPTATPFQPAGTGNPTEYATHDPSMPVLTPTPTPLPGTPTPVPLINRLKEPDGQVNILIFGSDYRPNSGYRTDVIMLLSVNTKKGTASLTSFPRDLYVDIPGWEMQRINTAQAHGGFSLTQKTFEQNFGFHPDHYVITNFNGFIGIIDTLGGIDVNVSTGLSDTCDLPQAVRGYCSVSPGLHHMNGATTLWYVRSRHSSSDFSRTRREQEVIQAIFTRLLSLNAVSRAPELYNQLKSTVETDMNLSDMLSLLPLATQIKSIDNVQRYFVDQTFVTSWVTSGGAQVLLPHTEDIFNKIIAKAVYGQ